MHWLARIIQLLYDLNNFLQKSLLILCRAWRDVYNEYTHSHTQTYILTCTHTHGHSHPGVQTLSHTCSPTYIFSPSLPLSLSHTHTHTHPIIQWKWLSEQVISRTAIIWLSCDEKGVPSRFQPSCHLYLIVAISSNQVSEIGVLFIISTYSHTHFC